MVERNLESFLLLAAFPPLPPQELINKAINAAMAARKEWDLKPVQDRAQIFLKAADMLSGPRRAEVLAKTMVGQVGGRRSWVELEELGEQGRKAAKVGFGSGDGWRCSVRGHRVILIPCCSWAVQEAPSLGIELGRGTPRQHCCIAPSLHGLEPLPAGQDRDPGRD